MAKHKPIPVWNGQNLQGKQILLIHQEGLGDLIQFLRYLPLLKRQGCRIVLHCQESMHRLILNNGLADSCTETQADYRLDIMELPFALACTHLNGELTSYLHAEPDAEVATMPGYKIGIAWEGNPQHSNNDTRSCHLSYFKFLAQPGNEIFCLQDRIHLPALIGGCDGFEFHMGQPQDMQDTAALIAAMDLIVSVDTSVLHLAGAMGKPALGLLSNPCDPRWQVADWYPTITWCRQPVDGDWDAVFTQVSRHLGLERQATDKPPLSVLFTGGIGDIITLEGYLSAEKRQRLHTVYYASRGGKAAMSLLQKLPEYANVRHEILWEDFSEVFAFYSKQQVQKTLLTLPADWFFVEDWSILRKFAEIDSGLAYNGCRFLDTTLATVPELPKPYVTVTPYSVSDDRQQDRQFDGQDWECLIRHLDKHQLYGVVLMTGEFHVPAHPRLFDLSNRTDLATSLEIVKQGTGYVGIDSCLSVIAAKACTGTFFVRSRNNHLYKHKHIYYAPRQDFSFLVRHLREIA